MILLVALLGGLGAGLAFLGLVTLVDRVLMDPPRPEPWWR